MLDEAVCDGLLVRNPAKDRAPRRIVGRSALPMAAQESPRDFALPDVGRLSRQVEEALGGTAQTRAAGARAPPGVDDVGRVNRSGDRPMRDRLRSFDR
jgi:hypothetical protein